MKKILTIAFILTILIFAISAYASENVVFETGKRILCDEINNTAMSSVSQEGSFGNQVYFSSGNNVVDPAEIKNPLMSFEFYAPEDGKYTIYTHGIFPNNGSDSFFFKVDDMPWQDVHPNDRGMNLVWVATGTINLTKGKHTFYWHHREVGSYFDCFSIIKSGEDFKVIIDGSVLESDVPPYIENNISMIPFRALGEALGAEVSWNAEERSATISNGLIALKIVENSEKAYWGKFPIQLGTPARIINGRFMVPIRFVVDNLQYTIRWTPGTNHAFIIKK